MHLVTCKAFYSWGISWLRILLEIMALVNCCAYSTHGEKIIEIHLFYRLISTFDAILFDVVPSMIDKGIFLLLKASNLMRNIPNVEVDQFERFLRLRYQNRGIRPAAVPGLTRSKFFDLDL
jgi:hypothetical protein